MIDLLVYHLLKEESQGRFVDAFLKNKARLNKVAIFPKRSEDDNESYWMLIDLICTYHDRYKTLPGAKTLAEFIKTGKDLPITHEWAAQLAETLKGLKAFPEVRLKYATDPNVIIDKAIELGRVDHFMHALIQAQTMAASAPDARLDGGKKLPAGPDDAKRYLLKELANDVMTGDAISGSLRDNAHAISEHLTDIFNADDTDRLLLGFEQADEAFMIGKQFMKFIGILGFSNEGKSLLTRTLAYNFALQGHKTLFVTLEGEDALDCMTKFSFLHGSIWHGKQCPIPNSPFFKENAAAHEGCTFSMPSYESWKQKKISRIDFAHVNWAVVALKTHEVPLYVADRKTMPDWDTIEAAVEAEKYECVVIDYIGILDIPGTKDKDRDFAVTALYDRAQKVCGRLGTVVVSPLQVNREGKKQADSKDPHQERVYSLVHVSKHSRAYEDMDVVIGVISSPEMKQIGEIKLEWLKVREGEYPKDFFADVNLGTKHVRQLGGIARDKGKEWAKQAKIQEKKMMEPDFSPM